MSNTTRLKLTLAGNGETVIGRVPLDREDDILPRLNRGEFIEVIKDNEKPVWVNLAHVQKCELSPKAAPQVPQRLR